jgi:hypothetical protein
MEGCVAARDFPSAIIQLAQDRFCLPEDDEKTRQGHFHSSTTLEPAFGLRGNLRFDFFPPSAVRGPFFALLCSEPLQAVSFIVGLLNHCIDWYANPRLPGRTIEPPWETELVAASGSL